MRNLIYILLFIGFYSFAQVPPGTRPVIQGEIWREQATPPSSPQDNEVYLDTDGFFYKYNGTSWEVTDNNDYVTSAVLAGSTLTLTIPNQSNVQVSLASLLDNTDNQTVTDFSLAGTVLSITLEDGNTVTLDIASIQDGTGTDDQAISQSGNTITLEDGGSVDISTTTAVAANTAKETNATHTGEVTGSGALTIASGVVDSDNIVDGTIDETDLDTSVNASLDLADSSIQTEVDGSTTNEIQNLSEVLTEGNDAGAVKIVNLADPTLDQDAATKAYVDSQSASGGTDDQNISGSGLSGTDLTIGIENGTNEVVDLSSLVGTDDQTAPEVSVIDSGGNFTATDVEGVLVELKGDIPSVSDLSYESVTYASSINRTYDPLRPNFEIDLTGDLTLNVTGASSGSGYVTITRGASGYEDIVLTGDKGNAFSWPVVGDSIIELLYVFTPNGLKWFYKGGMTSMDLDDYKALSSTIQDQITDIILTQQEGGDYSLDGL